MTNYQAILAEARDLAGDNTNSVQDRIDLLTSLIDDFRILIDELRSE